MNEKSDFSDARYYVYILYSHQDLGFYIGFTNNLKHRITEHSKGEVAATKKDYLSSLSITNILSTVRMLKR